MAPIVKFVRSVAAGIRWSRKIRYVLTLFSQRLEANKMRLSPLLRLAFWRPTDLCATVLFSFQGTDAYAQPILDRINDRTTEARRQSQREIDYQIQASEVKASGFDSYPHVMLRAPVDVGIAKPAQPCRGLASLAC